MTEYHNALGQPIGFPVEGWTARPRPPRTAIEGRYCRVEPIDPDRHAADLHAANREDAEDRIWTLSGLWPVRDARRLPGLDGSDVPGR